MAVKADPKLQAASRAYLEFLELGGELRFEDLTTGLIRRFLNRGMPIITGLSATYLYRSPREFGPNADYDDVRGEPSGHFVVLRGYDRQQRTVLVADPSGRQPGRSRPALRGEHRPGDLRHPPRGADLRRQPADHAPAGAQGRSPCRSSSSLTIRPTGRWRFPAPNWSRPAAYLTETRFTALRQVKVFNLCRSYRYQSTGYYVSLLATARGHKPLPDITTIQDLKSQAIMRVAAEDLDALIQKSFGHLQSKEYALSVYFGRNLAKHYDPLSQRLFKLFPAPFLRCSFVFSGKAGRWLLQGLTPVAASEIPADHREFVVEVAGEYFRGRRPRSGNQARSRYDLAILVAPDEADPPSDERALQRFLRAAGGSASLRN